MTPEIIILFIILASMAFLFFTELLPVDLTAFLGLLVLVYLGYLNPTEGFSGFSSPAVITMLSIFFITGAMVQTGLGDKAADRIYKLVGGNEVFSMTVVMLIGGLLSAFIFNIAATAVLMPAVTSLARRSGIAAGRLLMPLCFGTIMGGTLTLVGTPPNILSAEILENNELAPFSLFQFAPIGLALMFLGIVYMTTIGRKWLPKSDPTSTFHDNTNLALTYQLEENLFSISIPPNAPIVGRTLKETHLGLSFGVQVLTLIRNGRKTPLPSPEMVIEPNDTMLVQGNLNQLQELLRIQGISMGTNDPTFLEEEAHFAACIVCLKDGHPWLDHSPVQLNLRKQEHLTLAGIRRNDKFLKGDISKKPLKEGDELLLVGDHQVIKDLYNNPKVKVVGQHKQALRILAKECLFLNLDAGSEMIGLNIAQTKLRKLVGVNIIGVIRDGHIFLGDNPTQKLQEKDQLIICGDVENVRNLLAMGHVGIETEVTSNQLLSDEVGLVEVTLAPRSRAAGKTLADVKFRDTFGVQVIGLWREGNYSLSQLGRKVLHMGDALLVQGSWHKIRLLGMDPDFVVLSAGAHAPRRTKKSLFAIGALLGMILLVSFGVTPVHLAAFTAAASVVLFGAIHMEEAYRSVEWRVLFIVASILPVGIAMERTGAAQLVAENLLEVAGGHGPHVALLALCLLTSLLSQCLDGAPAVVLVSPVALRTAVGMDVDPHAFMMAVALSASAAFMTPFSHKANLLVMGAGGYSVRHYLKIGTPLTILFLVVVVLLTPLIFPF